MPAGRDKQQNSTRRQFPGLITLEHWRRLANAQQYSWAEDCHQQSVPSSKTSEVEGRGALIVCSEYDSTSMVEQHQALSTSYRLVQMPMVWGNGKSVADGPLSVARYHFQPVAAQQLCGADKVNSKMHWQILVVSAA